MSVLSLHPLSSELEMQEVCLLRTNTYGFCQYLWPLTLPAICLGSREGL